MNPEIPPNMLNRPPINKRTGPKFKFIGNNTVSEIYWLSLENAIQYPAKKSGLGIPIECNKMLMLIINGKIAPMKAATGFN